MQSCALPLSLFLIRLIDVTYIWHCSCLISMVLYILPHIKCFILCYTLNMQISVQSQPCPSGVSMPLFISQSLTAVCVLWHQVHIDMYLSFVIYLCLESALFSMNIQYIPVRLVFNAPPSISLLSQPLAQTLNNSKLFAATKLYLCGVN